MDAAKSKRPPARSVPPRCRVWREEHDVPPGRRGARAIRRPELDTARACDGTPGTARLVFWEDRAAWTWHANETGTRAHRVVRFKYQGGAFLRMES